MTRYFVLDTDRNPRPCDDGPTWGKWMLHADRTVARTRAGGSHVSTVFLGADRGTPGHPVLFETFVFGGQWNGATVHYATWAQAAKGHKRIVARAWRGSIELDVLVWTVQTFVAFKMGIDQGLAAHARLVAVLEDGVRKGRT